MLPKLKCYQTKMLPKLKCLKIEKCPKNLNLNQNQIQVIGTDHLGLVHLFNKIAVTFKSIMQF